MSRTITLHLTLLMLLTATAGASDFKDIHDAAARGTVADVRSFIEQGADIQAKDNEGKTPYDVADTEEKKTILNSAGGKPTEPQS